MSTAESDIGDTGGAVSPCCFMKFDDCSRSTTNGDGLLKSDPSGRLTILQLVKSLE